MTSREGVYDVIEMLDTSDFLDKVASAEPPVNVLPSPRPSNKGGLLVQSGSMDGFYLVMKTNVLLLCKIPITSNELFLYL